jgi:hypothetical protein
LNFVVNLKISMAKIGDVGVAVPYKGSQTFLSLTSSSPDVSSLTVLSLIFLRYLTV